MKTRIGDRSRMGQSRLKVKGEGEDDVEAAKNILGMHD